MNPSVHFFTFIESIIVFEEYVIKNDLSTVIPEILPACAATAKRYRESLVLETPDRKRNSMFLPWVET